MRLAIAALVLTMASWVIGSSGAEQSLIVAEHAWARATPKGAPNGAAYVTLANRGTSEDRLLGATSPAAQSIQFHSEVNENGVMKMRELPAIDVRPGASVVLKPGGIHMMMIGLKQQLNEGETVALTLMFEKAGAVEVTARIGKVAAMDDPDKKTNSGN